MQTMFPSLRYFCGTSKPSKKVQNDKQRRAWSKKYRASNINTMQKIEDLKLRACQIHTNFKLAVRNTQQTQNDEENSRRDLLKRDLMCMDEITLMIKAHSRLQAEWESMKPFVEDKFRSLNATIARYDNYKATKPNKGRKLTPRERLAAETQRKEVLIRYRDEIQSKLMEATEASNRCIIKQDIAINRLKEDNLRLSNPPPPPPQSQSVPSLTDTFIPSQTGSVDPSEDIHTSYTSHTYHTPPHHYHYHHNPQCEQLHHEVAELRNTMSHLLEHNLGVPDSLTLEIGHSVNATPDNECPPPFDERRTTHLLHKLDSVRPNDMKQAICDHYDLPVDHDDDDNKDDVYYPQSNQMLYKSPQTSFSMTSEDMRQRLDALAMVEHMAYLQKIKTLNAENHAGFEYHGGGLCIN